MSLQDLKANFNAETLARTSILVAEDDPQILGYAVQFLNYVGFSQIHRAADGNEALDILKRHPVDVIVSDNEMPGISGLELTAKIKQDEKLKSTLIIIHSGTRNLEKAAIEAGADAFVKKEGSWDALVAKVIGLAEQARSTAAHLPQVESAAKIPGLNEPHA